MSSPKAKFYITTTLPYVNAKPHIGFALEIIQADTIARYHIMKGDEVIFNTGTDEHGQKIYEKAVEEGKNPKDYVDEYAKKYDELKHALNLSYTNFIQTSDPKHVAAAQEFWKRCDANGDIYKARYQVKYCVGCELEKTDSELVDGRCGIHPHLTLQFNDEENYFFRFSKYQPELLRLYDDHSDFVIPQNRMNEISSFVRAGLKDFSISRIASKMPWGIAVPGDETQVMYVWFDALINYISTLGWPAEKSFFHDFWPGIQIAGKDNLRQQAAMWQAMLFSAGLEPSKQILIHGFLTVNGQKISKSIGNVVDPFEEVAKYGTDVLRYYLMREIPFGGDGDFSEARLRERYNGELANGLGNLVARVLTMIEKYSDNVITKSVAEETNALPNARRKIFRFATNDKKWQEYEALMDSFSLDRVIDIVWNFISELDMVIDDEKPWALAKKGDNERLNAVLYMLVESLRHIAWMLWPFMPETAQKIFDQLGIPRETSERKYTEAKEWGGLQEGTKINRGESLFPRLQ